MVDVKIIAPDGYSRTDGYDIAALKAALPISGAMLDRLIETGDFTDMQELIDWVSEALGAVATAVLALEAKLPAE